MSDELMPFTFPESGTSSIIKVIGVGGGGGNADMAQAGAKDPGRVQDAFDKAAELL